MRYVVFVCAILGALVTISGVGGAKGAPQEAAAAAVGLAIAIIPYVIFRTYTSVKAEKQRDEIIRLLTEQQNKSE